MRKFIQAKLASPYIMVELEIDGDELQKASLINEARKQLTLKMRKALENKMVTLQQEDISFSLVEKGL